MQKRMEHIYEGVFYFTCTLFFIKSIVRINDLYWASFVIMCFGGGILYFYKYRGFKPIMSYSRDLLDSSRWIVIIYGTYILIDLINACRAGTADFLTSKYILFVQIIIILICYIMICMEQEKKEEKYVEKLYLWISVSGVIMGIFSIINYVYPLVKSEYVSQISIILDYNTFCRYFLFSYVITIIYCYNKCSLGFYKKLFLIVGENILITAMIFMATSRRTILTIIAIMILLALYIGVCEIKRYHKKCYDITYKTFVFRFILAIIVIAISLTCGYRLNAELVDYVRHHPKQKIERLQDVSGRDSFGNIIKDITMEFLGNGDKRPPKSEDIFFDEDFNNGVDRMSSGDFFGKRKVIWTQAIEEIQSYDMKALFFGKGLGYSSVMYMKQPHLDAIKSIYALDEEPEKHFMHPHNFLLQDLLDGGIIKCVIALIITLGVGVSLVRKSLQNSTRWMIPVMSMILVASNIMISYCDGFVGDRYFGITLIIVMFLRYVEQKEKREGDINQCNSET